MLQHHKNLAHEESRSLYQHKKAGVLLLNKSVIVLKSHFRVKTETWKEDGDITCISWYEAEVWYQPEGLYFDNDSQVHINEILQAKNYVLFAIENWPNCKYIFIHTYNYMLFYENTYQISK